MMSRERPSEQAEAPEPVGPNILTALDPACPVMGRHKPGQELQ